MKFAILVSHPLYGSTYILNNKGELTEGRENAKKYPDFSTACKKAKEFELKLSIHCDAVQIHL